MTGLDFIFENEEITEENFTEEMKEQMRIELEELKRRTYLVWFFTFLGIVLISLCLFLKEKGKVGYFSILTVYFCRPKNKKPRCKKKDRSGKVD